MNPNTSLTTAPRRGARGTATPSVRAIAYLRVSTDRQTESGLGLEAQQAAITAAAARLGTAIAQSFTDAGVSGGAALDDRPGLMAAVQALRRGDVLVCAKRDRLGRDVLNVAMLERLVQRKGARIVSAAGEGTDGTAPADVLMRQMLDAFAQFERALIATRTKAALAAKRRRGERVSRIIPVRVPPRQGRAHAGGRRGRTAHAHHDPRAARGRPLVARDRGDPQRPRRVDTGWRAVGL